MDGFRAAGSPGVEGVILAAGLSMRAGCWKPAWRLGGRTLIEWAVASMSPSVGRIVVVGGFQADRLRLILGRIPKVEVIVNEGYESGMFSSVQAGLRRTRAGRVFLLPGDHPLVREDVYRALLGAAGDVVVPCYRGSKGHPILLSRRAVGDVLRAAGDATLRQVTECLGYTVVEVGDRGVLLDVDDPDDFQAVQKAYEHDNQ